MTDLIKSLRETGVLRDVDPRTDEIHSLLNHAADRLASLELALNEILGMPYVEQDNLISATMRRIAKEALK